MKPILYIFIICITIIYGCHKDPVYSRAETPFITGETDSSYIMNDSPIIQYSPYGFSSGRSSIGIDLNNDEVSDVTIYINTSHSPGSTYQEIWASTNDPSFYIAYRPVIFYDVEQIDSIFYPSKSLPAPANDTVVNTKYFISETIKSNNYNYRNLGEPKPNNYRIDTIQNWSWKVDLISFNSYKGGGPPYFQRPTFGSNWTSDHDFGGLWGS